MAESGWSEHLQANILGGCFITGYNLAVMGQTCDQVALLENGQLIESGEVEAFFNDPVEDKMDSSRIRKAELADAGALTSCIDAAYAQYADSVTDLPPVSAGCADEIVRNQVWVAIEDDEIIGGLFLVAHEAFMKLTNVAVHPDHAGKGLGRELIDLAEREAKKQGYKEIRLNTHSAMSGNVQLYIHLGWEVVSLHGNTVSMKKILREMH